MRWSLEFQLQLTGRQVKTDILQGSGELLGPWTDLRDATSPHRISDPGSQHFYRLRY
jgi:hypothetical protein